MRGVECEATRQVESPRLGWTQQLKGDEASEIMRYRS